MKKTTNLLKSYKRYYIEAGKTYGKYTTLEQVDYTTKSGNIEKRWKCKDSKGNISYRRARSLDCIEQSDALCDEINKELVSKLLRSKVKDFFFAFDTPISLVRL